MKKKLILIISILASFIFSISQPAFAEKTTASSEAQTANKTDSFSFAIDSDPLSLNPISANDRWGLTHVNLVFSPLARVMGDGTIKNELAEKILPAEDGLSVEVTLKSGLTWSDGQPLTAEDVIFTYETKIAKENGASDTLWIGEKAVKVEKIDEQKVKFTLPEVDAAMLDQVAADTYIIPKHVYENVEDMSKAQLDVPPVGSGPYKFVEYKKGEYLKYEANDSYYGGQPKEKNILLQIISNPDTAKVALQKGEVDAGLIQPADVKSMKKKDLNIYSYSENRVGYMGVNGNSKKLKDKKVRQAMFYALNKPKMNKATYLNKDYYANAYSILPPNNKFYDKKVMKYKYSTKKAKKMVKEADAEGTKLKLGYMTGDKIQRLQVNLIKESLEEVGFKVELSAVETAALVAEMQKPKTTKYDMYISGYIWGNDPDAYKSQFKSDGDFNIMHYKNPKVDELFTKGSSELDTAKRKDIYNELQETIMEDAVFYPIVDNKKILAVNDSVKELDEENFAPVYIMADWSKIAK
ncbi:MAG: ABC transporter substrate-binding protein [Enterococcus gilvus]|jgi:peptide/nickel transport system substrate-binding protein|uniref:ABC transporter substrate-binding protein n=3 Tax=Enterococcus gilvus TaxID=160453 RepID=UPI0039F51A55